MSAPDAATSPGFIALTVPAVPTGMNAGVRTTPRSSVIVPARAAPSLAEIEKAKRVIPAALTARIAASRDGGAALRGQFGSLCAFLKQLGNAVRADRAAKQIALADGATQRREEVALHGGFDALGHDLDLERPPEPDHRVDDRSVLRI